VFRAFFVFDFLNLTQHVILLTCQCFYLILPHFNLITITANMTNENAIGGTALVNPTAPGSALKHSLRSATRAKDEELEEAALIREEEKVMDEDDEEITSEEDYETAEGAEKVERTMLTVALVNSAVEGRKLSDDSGDPTDPSKHRYGLRKRRRQSGEDLRRLEHFQSTTEGGLARAPKRPEPEPSDEPDPKRVAPSEEPDHDGDAGDKSEPLETSTPPVLDDPKVNIELQDPNVITTLNNSSVKAGPDSPTVPTVIPKLDPDETKVTAMPNQPTATAAKSDQPTASEATPNQPTAAAAAAKLEQPAATAVKPDQHTATAAKSVQPTAPRKESYTSRDSLPQSSSVSNSAVPNPLNRPIHPPSSLLPNAEPKVVVSSFVQTAAILPPVVPCPLPAAAFEEKVNPPDDKETYVAPERKFSINESMRSRGFSNDTDCKYLLPSSRISYVVVDLSSHVIYLCIASSDKEMYVPPESDKRKVTINESVRSRGFSIDMDCK
jgi:hypothetical protein